MSVPNGERHAVPPAEASRCPRPDLHRGLLACPSCEARRTILGWSAEHPPGQYLLRTEDNYPG